MEATSQIDELKKRLAALDAERLAVAARLAELETGSTTDQDQLTQPAPTRIGRASSATAKTGLFRSLFRGREDVFALRWDNPKTGKAGYAPACRNEWVRGVCGKPKVRCGECPHQAFIPLSDEAIRGHLQGNHSQRQDDFVVGPYPTLPDDTCWFIAADFDKKDWMRDVGA